MTTFIKRTFLVASVVTCLAAAAPSARVPVAESSTPRAAGSQVAGASQTQPQPPNSKVNDGRNAGAAQATAPDRAPVQESTLDRTMQQMLKLREPSPIVNPVPKPKPTQPTAPGTVPFPSVKIDASVLGVAPGEPQPKLRREGEFIVARRGRLVRSSDGMHDLFIFEADSKQTPEPPMILQACQLLETMENIVQQRGDTVTFIVSGQIHTYRGANYLLPTMMKIAIDRGNLK